eukprot:COSAG03_NODE_5902_length_1151_cov_2070.774715_1_plen_80_part_10
MGVLVQSNYGSREQLRIAGAPVGEELASRSICLSVCLSLCRLIGWSVCLCVCLSLPPPPPPPPPPLLSRGMRRVGCEVRF